LETIRFLTLETHFRHRASSEVCTGIGRVAILPASEHLPIPILVQRQVQRQMNYADIKVRLQVPIKVPSTLYPPFRPIEWAYRFGYLTQLNPFINPLIGQFPGQ